MANILPSDSGYPHGIHIRTKGEVHENLPSIKVYGLGGSRGPSITITFDFNRNPEVKFLNNKKPNNFKLSSKEVKLYVQFVKNNKKYYQIIGIKKINF